MSFNDYQLEQDGLIICEPCLCITLFSNANAGEPDSPDMLGPYRAFMARFKDSVRYSVLDGNQSRAKQVKPSHFDDVYNKLAAFKRREISGPVAFFRNGKITEEVRTPAFDQRLTRGGEKAQASVARISLSLSWFEKEGLPGINQLLDECLQGFVLRSGYVGYCFVYSGYRSYDRTAETYFSHWLLRHPGLMNPSLSQTIASIFGLPDLGWITLLGQEFVEKMGGEAVLRDAVKPIAQAHWRAYPNGVIGIRMGDAPRMGDLQGGDTMEDYKALGKVLAPLRDRDAIGKCMSVPGLIGPGFEQYAPMLPKWINRFFPE